MQKTSVVIVLGVLALAVLAGYYAKQNMSTLDAKEKAQQEKIESLKRWKSAYKALIPYQKKWSSIYEEAGKVDDILSLYRMMRLETAGVFVDPEKLVVESVDRVRFNGSDIGLNRICVSSSGFSGLSVTSSSFANLVRGVENIASRKDIKMESVVLTLQRNRPTAILENFCIYLRN